jgi:hypothetical protein
MIKADFADIFHLMRYIQRYISRITGHKFRIAGCTLPIWKGMIASEYENCLSLPKHSFSSSGWLVLQFIRLLFEICIGRQEYLEFRGSSESKIVPDTCRDPVGFKLSRCYLRRSDVMDVFQSESIFR